jgi:CDP-diacylglycerol pyrophosphatase
MQSRSVELKFGKQFNYRLQQHSPYRFLLSASPTANRNLSKMGLAEIKLDMNDFVIEISTMDTGVEQQLMQSCGDEY